MKRLVVATHNPSKAREMIHILTTALPGIELLTLADFPGAPEPDEIGSTYAENAAIKAESACVFTGLASLADDAGLEIDALSGAPGVHSKRFEGPETPFDIKMERILERMVGRLEEGRTARFVCCVALAEPGLPTRFFDATCEGRISMRPTGAGGFGYDPIFFLPELGRTMAQLTPEEKHAVSHRGRVLAQVVEYLRSRHT